jgi:Ca2+-binding EF-hand superfamily protein
MKTNKIILASLAAVLVAGTALPSFAAPGRDGPGRDGPGRHGARGGMMQEMMFVRLLKTADADKNAQISKEELSAHQEAMFSEMDADKDGTLIPGEMRAYREAKMEEFREANPRPDRAERREERRQKMAQNNEAGDDGDSDRPDRRADRERRHEGGRHGMHHGGRMGPQMGGMQLIRQADTDENGQFSKAEVTAAVDKLFARMDRNEDGVISIDDMPDRPF